MDMKKIITCAVLLSGVVFFNGRLNAQVESDIVGYTTITMEAGKWYQVGCPFATLDDGIAPSLTTMFSAGFAEGDVAYIFSQDDGTYTTTRTWGTPATGNATWLNARGKASDVELTFGQAVFIKKATASDVTFAGKVEASEVVSFGSASGATWSQIIFPYPVATDLNEMKWEGLTQGDTLHLYDPVQGTYVISRTWTVGKTADDSELKWRNSRGKDVETIIPSGSAMFIQKNAAGVATLSVK